ncbi:sensor histidine kinase [Aquincola sp. S2]|uniref:histidine kinase n=1 Tax=Pseudaquabacterium terrae TaxID=2732868 RepID=A0ABX2ECU2_9BURK|nr:HAMP domain-containing sensor histidine kinase [Aquabacterium terrae]NRF65695.1 sensor histidine kinase [Aquabacterium terrae]
MTEHVPVNSAAASDRDAMHGAARELARLRGEVEQARDQLVQLRSDLGQAESQLGSRLAAQLLEANEHLVLSALRAHSDAETATAALHEAAESAELDALPRPDELSATTLHALPPPLVPHDPGQVEQRHAALREANENLVMAALTAQDVQAAAQRAEARQRDILTLVAHELRNPLMPMRTAADLLGMERLDPALLQNVRGVIERQVTRMTRLVNDLLDVSRVKTGKLTLDRRTVDMAEVIDTSVHSCRPAMDACRQRFTAFVPPGALLVDGDPGRLTQVLCNLLDNASKYTPKGGEINLSVLVADQDLVITVSDNGIGITAEALPRVFEPFVQDVHAVGFNASGLGLGLTVVRELVEAHDGVVVASSGGPGFGSQFVLTLNLIDHRSRP